MLLHEKFLDTCLKECLLASQDLLNSLTKILGTCVLFADHVHNFITRFDDVSIPQSLSPTRNGSSGSGSGNNKKTGPLTSRSSSSTTGGKVSRVSNRRVSAATTNSNTDNDVNDDELLLQQRAKKTSNELIKRKLKKNMQTDFIVRESRQESFARYRVLFEEKFDKEVNYFIALLCVYVCVIIVICLKC